MYMWRWRHSLFRSIVGSRIPSRRFSHARATDGGLFDKILVANRGEIACRIMRTAGHLGIRTVAVFSEADRNAMHVKMADEAFCIGPAPSSDSYLRKDKIMDVAKATGAQEVFSVFVLFKGQNAIHPGYGFLSENKWFAELCQSEGVEFIGPPASAIEKMGIKRVSKAIMNESGVPVVPGYYGDDQSDRLLRDEAEKIGYPVLIKADLGGGGKGMRVVRNGEEFQQLLESCRSESQKSFGDDKVLIEKYLVRPRHVEVQVFADKHGNTLHLFERDCSVQRRHQKIIEEAPAPGLHQHTREALWKAAVRAAQAVGYVGAGTVEFIMDDDGEHFYFMEMNTRLQVEHPVTEMVTGTDLVEWQLRVAAGETLPMSQSDLQCRGHAFEARVYAEDPDRSFMPSPGVLRHLQTPSLSDIVRVDTGVRQGDEVSWYYDPMIAKLVVRGDSRRAALKQLWRSLAQYQIAGATTNINFLMRLAKHPSFEEGEVHTGFIEEHFSDLFPDPSPLTPTQRNLAVLVVLALEESRITKSTLHQHDPFNRTSGIRVNSHLKRTVSLLSHGEEFSVQVSYHGKRKYFLTDQEGNDMECSGSLTESEGRLCLAGTIGNCSISANVAVTGDTLHIFTDDGLSFSVDIPQPAHFGSLEGEDLGGVMSPDYPSVVNKVVVSVGDVVKKGQVLMTLVGMKMETNILAPKDCKIAEVLYKEKDVVDAQSKLFEFKDA